MAKMGSGWNGHLNGEHGQLAGGFGKPAFEFEEALVLAISQDITAAMFGRRVAVKLGEGAGKVKLVRKTELVADRLDGQICAVQQLDGPLHP